ncbi:hypothetical protein [Pontibacter fetidus]|uniref:YD repeat-containing protein n=1 Tax=Pontibacter fetidus TaxID=2700082 RepID=A0A6B2H4M8_9BACT|nr:hypothetical protein [Pontibacter fetidus]NDK57353.1 hypothetical protein [Pontibacter fetidus]
MKTWIAKTCFIYILALFNPYQKLSSFLSNFSLKLILSCLFIPFVIFPGVSQNKSLIDIPTPNAASLGQYGQVPVSTFNGLPSISVPIYDFRFKDIQLPISLSYHAGGIRTEDSPGWVGLGWNLNAGGSITRIVNGYHDEIHVRDINKNVLEGDYAYPTNKEYGYFYRSTELDDPNWATQSFIVDYAENDNLLYAGLMPFDAEPDEFVFNVGDLSGSFYMAKDQNGNLVVKVKSKTGEHLKIEPVVSPGTVQQGIFQNWEYPEYDFKVKMERSFMAFTITRPNGMKYYFGGDVTSMDMNTVRTGGTYTTIATSWHLTKIESPDKYAVTLQYKKEGDVFVKRRSKYQQCVVVPDDEDTDYTICNPQVLSQQAEMSYSLQHPSYLSKIVAPDGRTVEFMTSPSKQLMYDYSDNYHVDVFDNLHDAFYPEFFLGNYYLQLDKIKIEGRLEATFNYSNNANQRLRLGALVIASPYDEATKQNYTFTYNSHTLPPYNSKLSDNWGYFNNKNYNGVDFSAMYNYRAADTAFMKAEILEKIVYPTGGETIFKFEAHDYSKIAKQYPFELANDPGIAGGLRVKKIISRTSPSDPKPLVWEYSYLNEDGTSSGILSGIPIYKTYGKHKVDFEYSGFLGTVYFNIDLEINQTYWIHTEYPQNPMSNTSGNHVTYSRVVEKMIGNGYTIFNYSNTDLYPDEPPVAFFYNSEGKMVYNAITSKELERGLLLSKKVFDENNQPVEETVLEYNNDPNRYEDYIKSINNIILEANNSFIVRLAAKKIYTFYPYLQKQTKISYKNGNAVTSMISYAYDPIYKQLKEEQTIDSRGQINKNSYKYPHDFPANQVFNSMKSINLINTPVEGIHYKGNKVIEGAATLYNCYGCSLNPVTNLLEGGTFKPAQQLKLETSAPLSDYTPATSAFNLDTRFKPATNFDQYDEVGNLLSYRYVDINGNTIGNGAYLWGNYKQLPTAQVLHAGNGEVAFTSFEEANNYGNWTYSQTFQVGTSRSGVISFKGSTITKTTLPNNTYQISLWAQGTAPITVNSKAPMIVTPVEGSAWKEYKWVLINPGSVTINNSGLNYIDDVRLHPINAQMTTYTYDRFGNMSSSSDPNSSTSFFSFDDLNRLKLIKDTNGNIIKYFDYKYKQ